MADVEKVNPYRNDDRRKDEQVQSMFDTIASAYDFMNHAMTGFLDRRWARKLVDEAVKTEPRDIIDLATGTGDIAFALAARLPGAHVIGLDLSAGMLECARQKAAGVKLGQKIEFIQADGLHTGLPDGCADVITIAYGVRNYADIAAGYREMYRLLRPGGRVCVLELSTPASALPNAFYRFYSGKVIPAMGRLFTRDIRAYSYLPESIAAAPQRDDMTRIMSDAGFRNAAFRSLNFGVVTLYTAVK